MLGYYDGLLAFDVTPGALVHWTGSDLLLLAFATGVALAPAAAFGLAAGIWRPRRPIERSVAVLAAAFAVLNLARGRALRHQRLATVPGALLHGAAAARARLRLSRHATRQPTGGASSATAVAVAIALGAPQRRSATTSLAWERPGLPHAARRHLAHVADGHRRASLLIALCSDGVLALSIAVALETGAGCRGAARRRRARREPAWSYGAQSVDRSETLIANETALGSDWQWVDDAKLGYVSMLVPRDALRWVISQQLFWNHSLTRVLTCRAHLTPTPSRTRASTRRSRRPARGYGGRHRPLLVQEYCGERPARHAGSWSGTSRLRPCGSRQGTARFVSLTDGRYLDGWLGWPTAQVTVWPGETGTRTGTLCLPLSLPDVGCLGHADLWGARLRPKRDDPVGRARARRHPTHGHQPLAAPRDGQSSRCGSALDCSPRGS